MAERKFLNIIADVCEKQGFHDLLETVYAGSVRPTTPAAPVKPAVTPSSERIAADSNALTQQEVETLKAAKERMEREEGDENDEILASKYDELMTHRSQQANSLAAKVDASIKA